MNGEIEVCFIDKKNGLESTVACPGVPRVGDVVQLDGAYGPVKDVLWMPDLEPVGRCATVRFEILP